MLDLMRKHASSWLIKVILGAIIISFVFFFGYSSYQKGSKSGRIGAKGGAVARINGTPISESEFVYFFDRNFEQMKRSFQGTEIPEFARTMAEQSTLQQLVSREVALQLADGLGIAIPDQELANTIRDIQAGQMGGEFDAIAYRHTFLPSFHSRYGMDFEQFVRQDLRLGALQELFAEVDRQPPEDLAAPRDRITWTFQTVTIDPKALLESKAIPEEAAAQEIASRLLATDPKEWQKILKPLKLEAKKVGPLSLAERRQLFEGKAQTEEYEAIFSLTPDEPALTEPLERDGKIFVVRLSERQEKKEQGQKPTPPASGFFQEWMGKLLAKAKVQDYLKKEKATP